MPKNTKAGRPPPSPAARDARRKIELIEYPEDVALVDHKGRTKPLYKPTSPRPHAVTKHSKATRVLLGLFPGLRALALHGDRAGTIYVVLGSLSLAMLLWTHLVGRSAEEDIARLHIDPRAALLHGALFVILVLWFEVLRLLSSRQERTTAPLAARVLAAMWLPAVVILVRAPGSVPAWPRLIEATWVAALVFAVASLPAVVWTAQFTGVGKPSRRILAGVSGTLFAAVLVAALLLSGWLIRAPREWAAERAASAGFVTLSAWLG